MYGCTHIAGEKAHPKHCVAEEEELRPDELLVTEVGVAVTPGHQRRHGEEADPQTPEAATHRAIHREAKRRTRKQDHAEQTLVKTR